MTIFGLVLSLRQSLLQFEGRIIQVLGFNNHLGPALAVQLPDQVPDPQSNDETSTQHGFLDNIFWMAAPKKRRTIEVNRCRRRNPKKLIEVKTNIVPCPECGHLKQKHILCGFCYEKVRKETSMIRGQIQAMEGKPLNTPAVETVVLYANESPHETDKDKRIVERKRNRPSWFSLS